MFSSYYVLWFIKLMMADQQKGKVKLFFHKSGDLQLKKEL